MEKRKQEHHVSFREKALNKKKDITIVIPLKGG